MRFIDNELDVLVDRLQERTNDWLCFYDDWNTIVGNISEKLVGYCICHGLWKLGYPLDLTNRPYSYNVKPKFRADPDGYRGIDFLLTINNREGYSNIFMIEVKNWSNYRIYGDTFTDEILDRFTSVDENRQHKWLLVINRYNVRYINQECDNNNIMILELPNQITHDVVFNCEYIKTVLSDFIDSFCSLITELSSEREYPYLLVETKDNKPKWDMIFQDILMGVSNDVIESRYNTTNAYISKCTNELRRWLPGLPDRRNKDWRVAWEVQD